MKKFRLPSGMEFSEDEVRVQAIGRFLSDVRELGWDKGIMVDMGQTEAVEFRGRIYAAVRDSNGTLKQRYRLRNDGSLEPLRRFPSRSLLSF